MGIKTSAFQAIPDALVLFDVCKLSRKWPIDQYEKQILMRIKGVDFMKDRERIQQYLNEEGMTIDDIIGSRNRFGIF